MSKFHAKCHEDSRATVRRPALAVAQQQSSSRSLLRKFDPIWQSVLREARAIVEAEPALARFITGAILDHNGLEQAIAHIIGQRLEDTTLDANAIAHAFQEACGDDPSIGEAMRADIAAVCERDPACQRTIEPVLYFKGFHALQTYRLAHWMWNKGRKDFALWLQRQSSEVFQTDINPAARIGKGILLDHATGLVIGSTAIVGDNVSILHGVTLGGTGKETGDRHPKIGSGVLIGAGAKILGNITIGARSKVAAGSVVLRPVPENSTVVGVPAKIIGTARSSAPVRNMDQMLSDNAEPDRNVCRGKTALATSMRPRFRDWSPSNSNTRPQYFGI
jgi:serine O-acetyltransferase